MGERGVKSLKIQEGMLDMENDHRGERSGVGMKRGKEMTRDHGYG